MILSAGFNSRWQLERLFVRRQLKTFRSGERGEGRLKALIYTAILVIGVYLAFKLVPLYVAQYQLKDKMEEQARFAVVNRYSDDQIRDNLFRVIQDLDIPATREDIKVASTTHGISISVAYTVPVDLLVYKTDLNFSSTSEGLDIMK
ncbi:MAG TPA: hypothetical protein VN807_01555 [Candidatus Sulfotelmatobacter sp.]|nr:hypothetical protein [Candidatus Sulfotelmatobacter sp.]